MKRQHQIFRIAHFIWLARTAPARKANRRHQPRRRIRSKRHRGKPARRHSHAHDPRRIHLRPRRQVSNRRPQILSRLAPRIVIVHAWRTRITLFAIASARIPVTAPHHDHRGPPAPRKLPCLRQQSPRRHPRPRVGLSRRPMIQQRQRVRRAIVRPHHHRL